MKKLAGILCGISLVIGSVSSVSATSVILDFCSLPSSQGWTYWALGNSVPETDVFSVSGGVLHQNTITVGAAAQGSNRYEYRDVVDPNLPFAVSVRARILDEEVIWPPNAFGFSFGVLTGTENFGIGIGMNYIEGLVAGTGGYVNVPLSTSIDTTKFHDYLLLGYPHDRWELYVDRILIGSGTPGEVIFRNTLTLGDVTGGTNAIAEVTRYSFSQPVPEPATMLLLASGLVVLAAFRKKYS